MLTNAVSSAVGRLYASTTAIEPRLQVKRIEAMPRLAGANGSAAPIQPNERDAREHAAQRAALTDGVRQVFESASAVEPNPAELGDAEPAAKDAVAVTEVQPEQAPTDPNLEEAILRFIHAVFRSIAEAENNSPATQTARGEIERVGADSVKAQYPGFSSSREQLGGRIEALASRLRADGDEADLLSDGIASGVDSGDLAQSFADVLQALGVKLGSSAAAEDARSTPPTRGNLVNLMHKLAHAMQGSPPVDEGLPTVGGLLHARA